MSSNCTQNELKKNSFCEQKEPQVSKGKDSKDKDSKGKLSQNKMTLRYFLDTHNLSSIDERFERKLTNFFYEKNRDISDQLSYCEYVFSYLKQNHNKVDAKLFFTVSLKSDVLARFYNSKQKENERKSTSYDIWPNECPVCGKYHFKNKPNGDCPLDMSKENSAEAIESARIAFENIQLKISESLGLFHKNLKKGEIS